MLTEFDKNDEWYGGKGEEIGLELDFSGKRITFRSGEVIDSISVDDGNEYGGKGGSNIKYISIPTNGKIILHRLHSREYNGWTTICYIELSTEHDKEVKIGIEKLKDGIKDELKDSKSWLKENDEIKIIGIRSSEYINALRFEKISHKKP